MRLLGLCLLLATVVGCTTRRDFTITTRPPDAVIKVDGVERGRGPITEVINFNSAADIRYVTANRPGYKESTVQLTRDYSGDQVQIDLRPLTRRINFTILPVPAVVYLNGQPLSVDPVGQVSRELEFTLDSKNNWTSYQVTAERPGFQPATQTVTWTDPDPNYVLTLQPMRKDVKITTTPSGAEVIIEGEGLGNSPVEVADMAFPVDTSTNEFLPKRVIVRKPGFDPIQQSISWDDGKSDYHIDMRPKEKVVRFLTEPSQANVLVEGVPVTERDENGFAVIRLPFPPVNEKGELKTYTAAVTKKTADTEWEPGQLTIAWDEGKTDYHIRLKEILTRPVPMVVVAPERGDDGWEVQPRTGMTVAMKDTTEGAKKESPVQLTRLPRGTMIDTLAISPDGTSIVFTILTGTTARDFRSQMMMIRSDGSGGAEIFSDGRTLDINPSFTPDGSQIVFSSNRAGKRLSVWTMSASGAPGITQITTGETNDLSPVIDSDPKPRLFYQAFVDTRPDARLFMTQLGTSTRTDLTHISGQQPRISPRGDSLVFVSVNSKTGKRDIYRMSDRGGNPQNLTNSPDVDEFDPVWSRDGSHLAFASDRGVDEEKRHNHDIWILDMSNPERPTQVTSNGSWDDCPAWDPGGNFLYFRSNRGGDWNIWKITVR